MLVNTFLYSVYGQGGGTKHVGDDGIVAYRNRWLDTLARRNRLDAILSLGQLADTAYQRWQQDSAVGQASTVAYRNVIHPTYPESSSASGTITKAAAMARLCASWNEALAAVRGVVQPDAPVDLVPYGDAIATTDLAPIPAADLPAGLPPWMMALDAWAARTGPDAQVKRATITVTIPRRFRTWPVLPPKPKPKPRPKA